MKFPRLTVFSVSAPRLAGAVLLCATAGVAAQVGIKPGAKSVVKKPTAKRPVAKKPVATKAGAKQPAKKPGTPQKSPYPLRGKLPSRGGGPLDLVIPPTPTPTPVPTPTPIPTPTPMPLEMFPFAPPPFDDTKNAVDVSWMNQTPAGKDGFIRAQGEHFVDGQGRPLRFWGVNLSYQGAFPTKEQAPKIAARLAKFGFNAVRLHQYETSTVPGSLWKAGGLGSSRIAQPREVDPEQLDRLDFFIAELIKRGIYINLNLHVGREAVESDGIVQVKALPEKDKGVNFYDPGLIALQKEFSRLMLTHVNPYLGRALKDEPGLAMVELTNENSLLGFWLADRLEEIPADYQAPLRERWNVWLKKRYDDDSLRRAWIEWDEPLQSENLLAVPPPHEVLNPDSPDGRLTIGLQNLRAWQLTTVAPAAGMVEADALSGATVDGQVNPGLTVAARTPGNIKPNGGVSWAFRLIRDNVPLVENQAYTLTFSARALRSAGEPLLKSRKAALTISGGYYTTLNLSSEWKKYSFAFRPQNLRDGPRQITLSLGNDAGYVQFSDLEMRAGGPKATPADWNLSAGVPLPGFVETSVLRTRRDFAEFLGEVEADFTGKMRRFLKQDIGVRCPLWISQAQFGSWGGLWRESQSDAIDVHAYWKHPDLGEGGWLAGSWGFANASMVTTGDDNPLSNFGFWRLQGKPFVISEWNSGVPSDFSAESLPMAAALGAWQDWAAIFVFDYHARGLYERDRIEGAFSIDTHPVKMAGAPGAALMFRRPNPEALANTLSPADLQNALPGDVAPAWDSVTLTMPQDAIWQETAAVGGGPFATPMLKSWRETGAARAEALRGKTYVRFAAPGEALFPVASRAIPSFDTTFYNDTRQIYWEEKPGLFTLDTPRSKLIAGFLGGRFAQVGELRVGAPTSSNNWLCAALSSLDGEEIVDSKKLLLTLSGKAENYGMGKGVAKGAEGVVNNDFWGSGPVQVEGINATIRLQTSLTAPRVWALDATGARLQEVRSTLQNGTLQFQAAPMWRTLWYEIAE